MDPPAFCRHASMLNYHNATTTAIPCEPELIQMPSNIPVPLRLLSFKFTSHLAHICFSYALTYAVPNTLY